VLSLLLFVVDQYEVSVSHYVVKLEYGDGHVSELHWVVIYSTPSLGNFARMRTYNLWSLVKITFPNYVHTNFRF
jgi:hypothetical protein